MEPCVIIIKSNNEFSIIDRKKTNDRLMELIREIEALNSEKPTITFKFKGKDIWFPTIDETGDHAVDPVEYYGEINIQDMVYRYLII